MSLSLRAVDEALRQRAPESLIEIGAPHDEYSDKAEAFHAILRSRPITEQDIIETWTDWIGADAWFLSDADAPKRAELVDALNALRR